MKKHYLYPGMVYAAKEETEISTLLGSCVTIVLFDPVNKIGGMNHYLLPQSDSVASQTARYGNVAFPQLLEEMKRLGAKVENLKAKVFGGGNVVSSLSSMDSIGQKNILFAVNSLEKMKIPIVEKNVGGEQGRRIALLTSTGSVTHRFNSSQESTTSGPILDLSGRPQLKFQKEVKVLIVDDSAAIKTLFLKTFQNAGLKVVGTASDPFEAREMLIKEKPDVMTLDIEMPKMNGVQFLEKVMKHMPLPTVMVSSLSADGAAALKCLELGAVEFFQKTTQHDPTAIREMAEVLVEKVKAAASTKLVAPKKIASPTESIPSETVQKAKPKALKLIMVGGNAGSADSIEQLITSLHQDTPPVVVACSTISSFLPSFIEKLKKKTKLNFHIGQDKMNLSLGNVYFIPSGFHGKIHKTSVSMMLMLEKGAPVNSQLPSSSVLFSSAAENMARESLAILVGGFGSDGTSGLSKLQDQGGTTVVQLPEETNFPFGPQTAIAQGVADNILSVKNMAQFLFEYRSRAVV
jgi:two-component system chemotaxis response regulator CheB